MLCGMSENALSKVILDSAFRMPSALGPGLLERVYVAQSFGQRSCVVEHSLTGVFRCQVAFSISF
jgi:hypothetical protein